MTVGGSTVDTVASAALPVTAAPVPQASLSLWDLIVKGGPIMIPIGILSVALVYLFVERLMAVKKASKLDASFMPAIKDMVSKGNIEGARNLCRTNNSPVARVVEKGLSRLGLPTPEIESALENTGKIEVANLEKNVGYLGTIAGIAPMFGFLGTIFGVIKIFYNISLADNISIGLIAGGLYEKMITSAAGLMIGILAFICHHLLVNMIDKTVVKIEIGAIEFLDIIQEPAA